MVLFFKKEPLPFLPSPKKSPHLNKQHTISVSTGTIYEPRHRPKEVALIHSLDLPECVFIEPGGAERRLLPGLQTGRIRAIAARILSRTAPGTVVGLLYPTSPDLVLVWLGCLAAGVQPLVMQYPTRKQSRQYWESSVAHTIGLASVTLLICDAHCASLGLDRLSPILAQSVLDRLPDGDNAPLTIRDFAIVQLSSGTTGHRKAMRLRGSDLIRHLNDYNQVLKLTRQDCIAGWLPLYHDMGYVACFVMPMLLGVPVVMMDPITWVQTPSLLFDAIERFRATHCYMPNFGFEIMARQPTRALPSMRLWLSCSEPVSPATARKFLAAISCPEDRFAACYAMAENIFAISLGIGITTTTIDDVEVISCGNPIPGVRTKLIDGEIHVRSPASIEAYMGGESITGDDGFYPTGDLGHISNDQLFVTGRRQDLLIQAGRKFMLSDIDLALNRLFPDIAGRAAALAIYDSRLGTETPMILIESIDFFDRTDHAEIASAIQAEINLDHLQIAFVPPRFLTKTSSGKINRKLSAAHWAAVLANRASGPDYVSNAVSELRQTFPTIPRGQKLTEVLDSLSLAVLRILVEDAGLAYQPNLTMAETEALLSAARDQTHPSPAPVQQGIRIASLADLSLINHVNERHLHRLEQRLHQPVTIEHLCLPPSPVILSDLIFCDYFLPRLPDQSAFASVLAALGRLRSASVILLDDGAEMYVAKNQAYGALSHNFERDPQCDLIVTRWQSYARQHHLLPITFVAGRDLPPAERTATLDKLSRYLNTPIFRVASYPEFAEFTQGWDYRRFGAADHSAAIGKAAHPPRLIAEIGDWIESQPTSPPLKTLPPGPKLNFSDLGHFCSSFAHQRAIDRLLLAYDRFCIAGTASSIPYIRRAIDQAGKTYVTVPSFAPEILATIEMPYQCLLLCGVWGDFEIATPAAAIMPIGYGTAGTFNINDPELKDLTFNRNANVDPESSPDWFHTFPLQRSWFAALPFETRLRSQLREAAGARSALLEANRLLDAGEFENAHANAMKALESVPGEARILAVLSKIARAQGQLQKAREWAEQSVAAAPSAPLGHRLLAAAALERGDVSALKDICAYAMLHVPEEQRIFKSFLRRATKLAHSHEN